MNNENLKPIEKLTPFTKMIMTIGTLPSSFYASMSYYESMIWLYEYLKNQVIPTVNNNAEAVEELQTAFTTLQNWIEHYFDNLDLQEEVNKKLDEMAEDGSLTNLIKDYVDPIYQAYEDEMNTAFEGLSSTTANRLLAQDADIIAFKGTINQQVAQIDNKVNNATSGSPKGVYATVSDLETADPDHDYIYVVTATGKWYYYDTNLTTWAEGGTYQSTGISTSDPVITDINSRLNNTSFYDQRNVVATGINLIRPSYINNGYWIDSSGTKVANADSKYAVVPVCGGNTVLLCLNKFFSTFSSAALGGVVLLDKNFNTVDVLDYANIVNPIEKGLYHGYIVCTIEIPSSVEYIMFTTKLAANFDVTTNAIMVYGSVDDFTVENYTIDLFELPVEITKIYNQNVTHNKPYSKLRWAVFGDSLTEVNSTAVTKYYDYISNNLGMSIVNYGVSGTGYRSGYDDNTCFYQRMANIDPDDFDFITIFGSGNDIKYLKNGTMQLGNATDFCAINQEPTNIAMAINRTIEQYEIITPTKPIGLITPTPWYAYCQSWKLNYGDAQLMQDYSNLIIEIGKLRGIPVLNLYNESNLRPWNIDNRTYYYNENGVQDGGTHPNSIGHKLISASIEEFIKSIFPQN